MKKRALLIVDVQNDFCPGGALAVPDGDKVVHPLNKYIEHFSLKGWPIFASRDWHPEKTTHFKSYGGLWPQHSVQDTFGAAFHSDLKLPEDAIILSKGMDPEKDNYSAFQGVDTEGKELLDILRSLKRNQLLIGGLATDYHVKSTVLDAIKNGFEVCLLMDAIKGVNLHPGDSDKAIKEMVARGVKQITFSNVPKD